MPDRQESTLRFSLEESVWFEKGQEVAELISISLEPHISLLEEDEFIVLKGSLTLNGEYNRCLEDTIEHFPSQGVRYVQNVEQRTDIENEFTHQFPVDITIPKRRIANLSDVKVEVYSFDYNLPQYGHLQVEADLNIYGILNESEQINIPVFDGLDDSKVDEVPEEDLTEIKLEVEPAREESTTFTDEEDEQVESVIELSSTMEGHVQDEWESHTEQSSMIGHYDEVEEDSSALTALNRGEEEEVESVREGSFATVQDDNQLEESTAEIDLYEPFTAEARMISDQEKVNTQIQKEIQQTFPQLPDVALEALLSRTMDYFQTAFRDLESSSLVPEAYEVVDQGESSSSGLEGHVDESHYEEYEEEEKVKTKKKKDKYKSMSFADFFARKEESPTSKLKICLVQQGDSLQMFAEKYKVSVQQILRANHMDASQDVYEGQVLYIPTKASQKS